MHHTVLLSFFLIIFLSFVLKIVGSVGIDVGVVLDLEDDYCKKNLASISLALDEFYVNHSNFSTRVVIHPKDSKQDTVGATSAALDLLKNEQVHAIIGPLTSSQAKFVIELGSKTRVPVLSFSASSPSLSSVNTYFIRTTLNDSAQVGAIAAIVKSYGWRDAVPIYEDTEYGNGFIPFLVDAFTQVETRVPYRCTLPLNASDDVINMQLNKLMAMQTRVFVVHMMPLLGSRLFHLATAAGLMSKGYVWIITDGLTNGLDTMHPVALESMEGVLGVRPYIRKSKSYASFAARLRARFIRDNPDYSSTPVSDPMAYELWAYDTIWALALAVEKLSNLKPRAKNPMKKNCNSYELDQLEISETGPQLLAAISDTQFDGIGGHFLITDGQIQSDVFEIVNVVGSGKRNVGFWSSAIGLRGKVKSNATGNLKQGVIWPGDSTDIPKGWDVATTGRKLVIGVPVKKGFTEFVKVERHNDTGELKVTGFSVDVFLAVLDRLGYAFPYEFNAFEGSYDELVKQVYMQSFDAVVGDISLIWSRTEYVDFTLPYTESGVSMIVPVKQHKSKNMWFFLKPLTTYLWATSFLFFIFTGFVVWAIEHRINQKFRGSPSQQLGTTFYFTFSTLVFSHKERLESNLSKFVVIVWIFVVLILSSSYTASLTSMLTLEKLKPTITDVDYLIKNGLHVGFPKGAFIKSLLTWAGFDEKKIKQYSTPEEYNLALSNGSVAAIFHEIPYLKVFLGKYCNNYTMVGPLYKTDGLGFAFPKGSPLVHDVSRAILNVTQGNDMAHIESKWFGDQIVCNSDDDTSTRLKLGTFGGLFLITGVVSSLALLCFLVTFIYKEWASLKSSTTEMSCYKKWVARYKHFDNKDLKSHTFRDLSVGGASSNRNEPAVEIVASPTGFESQQSPFSVISNLSDMHIGDTPLDTEMMSGEMHDPNDVTGEVREPEITSSN